MAKDKKNEFTTRKIKKDIKKAIKNNPIGKDDSRIEKVYLRKKAIEEYYRKNGSKIDDNVLIDIYNKIYNPNIIVEIAIGILSGMAANWIGDLLKTKIPYTGESKVELIGYILAIIIAYIVIIVLLFFVLVLSYKKILSLSSYTDEVDNYHKDIVGKLIEKREADYEKRDKNEPKRKKRDRKHK